MKKQGKLRIILSNIFRGGFGIVIPTFGMIAIVYFIYEFILKVLYPITWTLEKTFNIPESLMAFLTFAAVVFLCFICGIMLKTKFGSWFFMFYETILKKLKVFKIFNAIREIYEQLTSDNLDAFKEFVMIYPFGRDKAAVPAFIIEKYISGDDVVYIVFAPTVPNPTSGFSYHLKEDLIERHPEVSVEKAFRSIVSCGVGAVDLLGLKGVEVSTKTR